MVPALFVIDDFLDNPEAVRSQALKLTYAVQGHYPGLNSIEKITIRGLEEAVSAIIRQPVHAPWTPEFSHGSCRVALAGTEQPARIHTDPSQLSGILYLSRPEDCRGGTEFFRHKRTNTDRMPMDKAALDALGYASFDEMHRDIIEKDAGNRSKWEHTMTVPMRYNRLILLQPNYWHTSGEGFGDSLENGRLIYVMFFKVGRPAPPAAK